MAFQHEGNRYKMLYQGLYKFGCEKCIRGHRGPQCKHYKRPLYYIRPTGRPQGVRKAPEAFEEDQPYRLLETAGPDLSLIMHPYGRSQSHGSSPIKAQRAQRARRKSGRSTSHTSRANRTRARSWTYEDCFDDTDEETDPRYDDDDFDDDDFDDIDNDKFIARYTARRMRGKDTPSSGNTVNTPRATSPPASKKENVVFGGAPTSTSPPPALLTMAATVVPFPEPNSLIRPRDTILYVDNEHLSTFHTGADIEQNGLGYNDEDEDEFSCFESSLAPLLADDITLDEPVYLGTPELAMTPQYLDPYAEGASSWRGPAASLDLNGYINDICDIEPITGQAFI